MDLNNVDLNKIRVFHSVVKNGNYQLAGEDLGLTRSAISQSMTTLEAQLGVKLFQRKGRRLFPTQKARELSDEFAIYQHSLNQMLQKVKSEGGDVQGTIRIGSYYEFAKMRLSKKITEFCTLYPNAKFKLFFDSPSRLQRHLEAGRIDMNFSIFPHEGSSEIESIPVLEQELVLVAPVKWAKKVDDLSDLVCLPVVEYYSSHKLLSRWLKTHYPSKRPKIDIKIFAASAEMLLEFVKQGVGIGVVPLYLLNSEALKGIKIIRPTNKRLTDYIWLNQFTEQFENSAQKKFFELMKSGLNQNL